MDFNGEKAEINNKRIDEKNLVIFFTTEKLVFKLRMNINKKNVVGGKLLICKIISKPKTYPKAYRVKSDKENSYGLTL